MFDTATLLTPAPQAAQPGRSFDVDSLLTYQVNGPTDFQIGRASCRERV